MARFATKPHEDTPIHVSIENSDDDVDIFLELPGRRIMVAYFSGSCGVLVTTSLDNEDQETLEAAGIAVEDGQIKVQ